MLVKKTRKSDEKNENPTYALIDSQSVKTVYISKKRGFDGGKKRKDESDTYLLAVHAANIYDTKDRVFTF